MYSYGNSDKGRVEMMKIRKLLCGMIGLLMLMSSGMSIPAFALGEGSYIVSNTTYYINPDTGTADGRWRCLHRRRHVQEYGIS